MPKSFLAVILILIATLSALIAYATPKYSPDGVVYARMMLADRGYSQASARREVRQFYLRMPIARGSRYRPFLLDESRGMFTATAKPFASRVLYPLVASTLYPWEKFRSLILVSALSYIIATLGMYWLLLQFCTPQTSAFGALLFALSPVLSLSGAALTDMTALCFLITAIGAMIRYALRGGAVYLALALGCDVALSLTRPLPYVPLGAALSLLAFAVATRSSSVPVRRAIMLAVAAAAGWAAYELAATLTHTPPLSSHLHWLYNAAKTHWIYESSRPLSLAEQHSFAAWYAHQLVVTAMGWIKSLFTGVYPAIALIICGFGLYLNRKNPVVAILAGGIIACCLGIFANPVEIELRRLIEVPATVCVIGGIAMFVQFVAVDKREYATAGKSRR